MGFLNHFERIKDGAVVVFKLNKLGIGAIVKNESTVSEVGRLFSGGRDIAAILTGAMLTKWILSGGAAISGCDVDRAFGVDEIVLTRL